MDSPLWPVAGELAGTPHPGRRTTSYRTVDDRLVLEEPTAAFWLTPQCERRPAELGVPAGQQVRVELRDADGRLLDARTFIVAPVDA